MGSAEFEQTGFAVQLSVVSSRAAVEVEGKKPTLPKQSATRYVENRQGGEKGKDLAP